ncbi:MAG: MFS transporter [Actinomycetes bacterium]
MTSHEFPVLPRAGAGPGPEAGPVSHRALTVGLCTTIVAIAFETIAVATAMPAAARDLDGIRWYAWSFSLFLIAMLFTTVVTGRLADRIGPAKPLIVGLVVFSAGLVVSGTASHMAQLVVGRGVQGLGSGLMNTAIFVTIAQVFDPRSRPRMFTYISTAWVLPSFVGPPVSAWLTSTLSWHWVFLAVLPLVAFGAVMVLPTLVVLMRSHPGRAGTADPARPAPIWAAGIAALAAAALQRAGQRLDAVAVVLVVAGLGALAVSLPALMPGGFGRFRRGLPMVMVSRGLLAGAFVGAEAFVPLMLVEQRGLSLGLAGAVLTVGAVGWTAGSYLQSRPWVRIRRDRLVSLGCASLAFGIAVAAVPAAVPPAWAGLVALGWVFAGLGMGLATSSTSLAVMTLSPEREQGRNAASLNFSDALGAGLFVGVSGTVFAALHPRGDLELTFGVLLAAMVLVAAAAAATSLRIGAVRNELGTDAPGGTRAGTVAAADPH